MTGAPHRADSVLRVWTKSIVAATIAWLLLHTFVVEAFRIPSASMENTLLVGDFMFVNKALFGAEIPLLHRRLPALREPRRGDVLVFDGVEEGGRKLVKRLIGLAGDTLSMRRGRLIRNGRALDEPYVRPDGLPRSEPPEVRARMRDWQLAHLVSTDSAAYDPDVDDWGPIVVPADSLFVLGDNRENSRDSRYWGFLPRSSVRGRPMLVYFSYDVTRAASASFLDRVRWHRIFSTPE